MLRATLWSWNQPFWCFGFFYWSFAFCFLFYFPVFLSCAFVPSCWVSSFISAMNLQVCISILFLYLPSRLNGKIRNRIQALVSSSPQKPYFFLPFEMVSLPSGTHFETLLTSAYPWSLSCGISFNRKWNHITQSWACATCGKYRLWKTYLLA